MENLMYKDWKAENEAKIGMRFGEVKSSGLDHVELPLELSRGSSTTMQSSLVNGGEEAKDAEEEEEAKDAAITPQQRQGLHVPAAEEEGRGKRRIQAPNRLTYEALGKPAKSALTGVAMMVGDDEETEYEEFAFAFFSLVEMPWEPATLKEVLEISDAEEWKKAMESELKSIEENVTWELVELPEGRKAITSKWLFKIKSDADGKIERYKSRLPEGFDDGSGIVWKLKKALYGLKQAPRQWYLKLREVLEEIGFTPSSANHSLFMLGEGEQRSFMVVYVDEILIFSPSSDLVKEVMLKLQDKFKCKALGDVSFYLGLHIERDVEKRCMRVHQRKYLEALAANFGQSEGHVATPFLSGFKCVKGPEEESVGEEERRRFHSLVGSLMYAAVNTRPDVAFATGQLARVVQCPNEEQVVAGMRVAKYLGQKAMVGLQYSAAAQRRQKGADGVEPGRLFLTAFSDSSYALEPEDMTSHPARTARETDPRVTGATGSLANGAAGPTTPPNPLKPLSHPPPPPLFSRTPFAIPSPSPHSDTCGSERETVGGNDCWLVTPATPTPSSPPSLLQTQQGGGAGGRGCSSLTQQRSGGSLCFIHPRHPLTPPTC
ncbi:unnamed protein product [Closterium sp. NIES-54]